MASKITLYHYTSKEGADGIKDEKRIRQSTNTQTDAKYGKGVYLTSMSRENFSKTAIAKNNYDSQRPKVPIGKINKGYLDYVVEVIMEKDEVEEVDSQRDIYLYPDDLYLDDGRTFNIKEVA